MSTGVTDWATKSGSVWARRWHDTDRGLAALAPELLAAIQAAAPSGRFRAFEIGCGPGSTTMDVAATLPHAKITACDVSLELAEIARQRTKELDNVRVVTGDAEAVAAREGPFDLFFSRHGVMFFDDPVHAFRRFRDAANPGAAMVFSCFQNWQRNPWACDLACAAAGEQLPAPGREPSGFAFADPGYVREILAASGWTDATARAVSFEYVAGEGNGAVDASLAFFCELGPSSRLIERLPDHKRVAAIGRMRHIVEARFDGEKVVFPAAAWIWLARAGGP